MVDVLQTNHLPRSQTANCICIHAATAGRIHVVDYCGFSAAVQSRLITIVLSSSSSSRLYSVMVIACLFNRQTSFFHLSHSERKKNGAHTHHTTHIRTHTTSGPTPIVVNWQLCIYKRPSLSLHSARLRQANRPAADRHGRVAFCTHCGVFVLCEWCLHRGRAALHNHVRRYATAV